jgi:asparagine synthase (glutamine-hydrolysing)
MCGIAGYIGPGQRETGLGAVGAMLATLHQRGPDSEGIESWPDATLGHRRLAIIDLSPGGHQPMLSDDGQIGLVFNGCIYNFVDLRRELERNGHAFRSRCDTEVILRGYEQWGIDQLTRRLRGMFAFAVWDNRTRTLALVRDRLGVKPLVYAVENGRIAFSSTVTALRAAGLAGTIDPQAILEFLEFGHVTEARTVFQEAKKVAPATILEWRDGRLEERSYWTLPEPDDASGITFDEAVERTEQLLLDAVRLRLQADVPIGALLSAGIDSSLVCWALARLNANVCTFTVSTPGDEVDEAPEAAETARRLGVPHQVVTLSDDGSGLLDELTEAYGEPLGCSSALAMLRVSRAVRPFATVLLTGDGGDDVFLGYRAHTHFLTAQRLAAALPSAAGWLWRGLRPITGALPGLTRGKHLLDYATGGLGAVTRVHDGLPYFARFGMFGPQLTGRTVPQRHIELSMDSARRLVLDVVQYDLKTQFPGEFMTKVDGATMRYSLEARSPFLDQAVWEFAAKLPVQLRLRKNTRKAVLREIVRRNIGEDVASRKKQGFTIPVERWLATRWKTALQEIAGHSLLEDAGWLRRGALDAPIAEGIRNGWAPVQLWRLLVLERWLQHNAKAQLRPAPV